MIGSAGMSILMLALFNTSFYNISLAALRPIELILFAGSLFLLRRFRGKVGAVSIILGSGAVGPWPMSCAEPCKPPLRRIPIPLEFLAQLFHRPFLEP